MGKGGRRINEKLYFQAQRRDRVRDRFGNDRSFGDRVWEIGNETARGAEKRKTGSRLKKISPLGAETKKGR